MQENHRILITDDGSEQMAKVGELLTGAGCQVTLCPRDGVKALEAIEALHPNVALIDMIMPRLDAIGVLRQLAQKPALADVCVVVVSLIDNHALEREMMESGACYYFLRPFLPETLAERILQIGGLSRRTPEPPAAGQQRDLELEVTEIIHQIGVPAHIKGYHYLRESIMLAVNDPNVINMVTKQLYPAVARRFGTTPSRVERAIRHAIEVAWDRGDVEVLGGYFGYTIQSSKGKPTNSEFVAMIADRVRLRRKNAVAV